MTPTLGMKVTLWSITICGNLMLGILVYYFQCRIWALCNNFHQPQGFICATMVTFLSSLMTALYIVDDILSLHLKCKCSCICSQRHNY